MELPEKLINFRVYDSGTDLLGVADVQLPDLEWMTETISGAGVAGEVESPVLGHFKPLSLKLKWRAMSGNCVALGKSQTHHLDCRGSVQRMDPASGEFKTYPVKCVVKAIPKKVGLGKMEMGKTQDNEVDLACSYLKLWVDGKEVVEIDKYNYIAMIDGVDQLASVRSDLGLG